MSAEPKLQSLDAVKAELKKLLQNAYDVRGHAFRRQLKEPEPDWTLEDQAINRRIHIQRAMEELGMEPHV